MKVLLVDDSAVVRTPLRWLFAALSEVEVSEAATWDDTLTLVRAEQPALVLLDLDLGGLKLLRRVLIEHRDARALAMSTQTKALYATSALRAGAAGYISKNTSPEELMEAVRRVVEGARYIDAEIAEVLALQATEIGSPTKRLTERDLENIRFLGDGQSLSNIAAALGVSYNTVANTCRRIKAKLGVARTADLVRLSIEKAMPWSDSMP
jgi:two-component system invasion response regulator UvrY